MLHLMRVFSGTHLNILYHKNGYKDESVKEVEHSAGQYEQQQQEGNTLPTRCTRLKILLIHLAGCLRPGRGGGHTVR